MDWRPAARQPALFFISGLVLAFVRPSWAEPLGDFIYTPLIIIMYLSTTEISLEDIVGIRKYAKDVLVTQILNYFCLSGVIILAAWIFLGNEPNLYNGFVVMAAMPVAVAVVPLAKIMGGDLRTALMGTALIYVLALFVAPTIVFLFAGGSVNLWKIVEALVLLIVFPLLASRFLRHLEIDRKLGIAKDVLINCNFFFIIFIVVGVNVEAYYMDIGILSFVLLVCFIRTFAAGLVTVLGCRALSISRERGVPMVLFGAFKNLGLTAAIAFVIFGEDAALPAAVCFAFEFMSYIGLHPITKYWLKGDKIG